MNKKIYKIHDFKFDSCFRIPYFSEKPFSVFLVLSIKNDNKNVEFRKDSCPIHFIESRIQSKIQRTYITNSQSQSVTYKNDKISMVYKIFIPENLIDSNTYKDQNQDKELVFFVYPIDKSINTLSYYTSHLQFNAYISIENESE